MEMTDILCMVSPPLRDDAQSAVPYVDVELAHHGPEPRPDFLADPSHLRRPAAGGALSRRGILEGGGPAGAAGAAGAAAAAARRLIALLAGHRLRCAVLVFRPPFQFTGPGLIVPPIRNITIALNLVIHT